MIPEIPMQDIAEWAWDAKYRYKDLNGKPIDKDRDAMYHRVAHALFKKDKPGALLAEDLMKRQLITPAGRILAGAGTAKRVTLFNCYVMSRIQDSMETDKSEGPGKGIMNALTDSALTMQQGGGIGMDFSELRPKKAAVVRTHSISDGPLKFMDMWDAMCRTIMSSGSRRGAMMGTLRCDHPDVEAFIEAKHVEGVLKMFNVSVLITDPFMEAVENGTEWELGHRKPRADGNHVRVKMDADGKEWYVYKVMPARELWDKIIRSTYEYAEPGVIFIDRINRRNNLGYCETIYATNPCGEQPLPPYGACDLGHIVLARMVKNPFTDQATIDWGLLQQATSTMVHLLDNVLDESDHPRREQRKEAQDKRRIGLGVTGLANMLQQLGMRYGSPEAVEMTRAVKGTIANEAYKASALIAKEKGPFPLYNPQLLAADLPRRLQPEIRELIDQYGLRNGTLLTDAPTGTTSLSLNNISSGIEPTYAWMADRNVLDDEGNLIPMKGVEDYGYALYKEIVLDGQDPNGMGLPDYMVTTEELSVDDHLATQAAAQEWVDASISKTVNCPESMSFDDFRRVYEKAYSLGCKGCTTYRPSTTTKEIRGSVISKAGEGKQPVQEKLPRPDVLIGSTYKVDWPHLGSKFYVTFNWYEDDEGRKHPFEMFINGKSTKYREWTDALGRLVSAIFRSGKDSRFVVAELEQVFGASGGMYVKAGKKPRYVASLPAMFGHTMARFMKDIGYLEEGEIIAPSPLPEGVTIINGEICPMCDQPSYVAEEGCHTCYSCGHSDCG